MNADAVDDALGSDGPLFVVRPGTWFLIPPPGTNADNAKVVADILQALKSDTRVLEVIAPDLNDYWTSRMSIFPDGPRATPQGILTGVDAFKALELSNYMRFKVRVPIKNQRMHHGADDIPSDTYWVAWNGISVFVMWEQEDHDWIPISAGHVVEEILRDVLRGASCHLYVQACGPHCDYGFLHTSIRIESAQHHEDFSLVPDADDRSVRYSGYIGFVDPFEGLDYLAISLGSAVGDFATYKNAGRRIIDIEDALRGDLTHLLSHYHEHALLMSEGYAPKALHKRWKARGWRREAWSLVSSIWLGMANIETMRRSWSSERADLLGNQEVLPLLHRDSVRDAEIIEGLEVDPIAETVNQVASALNNRMAVTASVWGALAGGVAGGAAGIIGQ